MKKCTTIFLIFCLMLFGAGSAFAKSSSRQDLFDKCDGGKGFLTQDDFTNCYLKATARFQTMDANRDGKVTKAEIKDARAAAKKNSEARMAARKAKREAAKKAKAQ